MKSPFWGPSFDKEEIRAVLDKGNIKYEELEDKQLIKRVVGLN